MYVRDPKEPLISILGTFTDSFLHLGISEFTICEKPSFYIIKAKQDWLDQDNNFELASYFNSLIHIQQSFRALQAEVFLTAFYFPFYTAGNVGEYGNKELLEICFGENKIQELESFGRILIIFKEQNLPDNHGINFKKPERRAADLINERKWLDIAIEQAKLNEQNSEN